jgi:hypothetical protein
MRRELRSDDAFNKVTTPEDAAIVGSDRVGAWLSPANRLASNPRAAARVNLPREKSTRRSPRRHRSGCAVKPGHATAMAT